MKHEQIVQDAFIGVEEIRPETRHKLNYALLDKHEDGYKRYRVVDRAKAEEHQEEALIHFQIIHGHPNRWPQQIHWRRKGVVYTNHTGVGYVRRTTAESGRYKGFQKEFAR